MIKLQNYTPEVYYKKSRDFQFIGRLYDLVLNSVKTNTDLLYSLPVGENMNDQLVDLITLSLGFKPKHNYSTQQLLAICSIFPTLLRKKGTLQAVQLACTTILASEGIITKPNVEMISSNRQSAKVLDTLHIGIPPELSDITLIQDLLSYIIPAGMLIDLTYESITENKNETSFVLDASKTKIYKRDPKVMSVVINPQNESDVEALGLNSTDSNYYEPIEAAKAGMLVNMSVIDSVYNPNSEENT